MKKLKITHLLEGKVLIISGGTKGVGKAAALEAVSQGALVAISGRDRNAAHRVLQEVKRKKGKGIFIETDLRKVADCQKLFDETFKKWGKIDGFFHYAGITNASSIEEIDLNHYRAIFETNFQSALFCCKEAIKYMKKNKTGGSIVINGSPHAWGGEKDRAIYACSKGALLTLTEHIAKNYADFKIRSNYITMGWTATEGELKLRKSQDISAAQLRKQAAKTIPAGRMTEAEDIVPGILYLLSDFSKMVSGSNLRVTGGWYI